MENEELYIPISPLLVLPNKIGAFSVYLKHKSTNDFVLYCPKDQMFTEQHKQRLHDVGIENVYIHMDEKLDYTEYIKKYLGIILDDETIPLDKRSETFYNSSLDIIKESFNVRLPVNSQDEYFSTVKSLVSDTIRFLGNAESLKSIAKFMKYDYDTFNHCMNVYILTISLLKQTQKYSEEELIDIGIGSLMHDIGKVLIDKNILNKPGKLTSDEFDIIKHHCVFGISHCMHANLKSISYNVVLYHHEKLDGSGYPAHLKNDDIPYYLRAVTICDIYDALVSKRPYADTIEPYNALIIMKNEFVGKIDVDLFKQFIQLLSGSFFVTK